MPRTPRLELGPPPPTKPASAPAARPLPALAPPGSGAWTLPVLPLAERKSACETMRGQVAGCTLCPELVANRTQTVFGVGNLQPELVFFGEAPGADEDRQGEPFVGAAGRLLMVRYGPGSPASARARRACG